MCTFTFSWITAVYHISMQIFSDAQNISDVQACPLLDIQHHHFRWKLPKLQQIPPTLPCRALLSFVKTFLAQTKIIQTSAGQTAVLHKTDIFSVVWIDNCIINTAVTLLIKKRALTFPEVKCSLYYPNADLTMCRFCLSFQCNRQIKAIQNLVSHSKTSVPLLMRFRLFLKKNKSKKGEILCLWKHRYFAPLSTVKHYIYTITEGFLMWNRRCSAASKETQIFDVVFWKLTNCSKPMLLLFWLIPSSSINALGRFVFASKRIQHLKMLMWIV